MKRDIKTAQAKLKTEVHNIYSANICTSLGLHSVLKTEKFQTEIQISCFF